METETHAVEYQEGEQLFVHRNGQFRPVKLRVPGRKPKYPLHRLEVNESFFIPFRERKPAPMSFLFQRAKKLNIKIKQRVLTEQGQPGVRVWRVK
jgi:hypothetical protein